MNNVRVANLELSLAPTPGAVMQQVAVDTVVSLAALKAATCAVKITVATAAIRVTFDGVTAPVGTTTGHYYAANTSDVWSKQMAAAAIMIKDGGSAGAVSATELTMA
jgi:hypothetical protein